ncbi:MAG: flagellar brake protein [bacterium]
MDEIVISRLNIDGHNPFGATAEELLANSLDESGLIAEDTLINSVLAHDLCKSLFKKREEYKESTKIGNILIKKQVITEKQLQEVVDHQQKNPNKKLGDLLVDLNMCQPDDISCCLDIQKQIRFNHTSLDYNKLNNYPAEIVKTSIEKYFPVGQKLSIKRTFANEKEMHHTYIKDLNKRMMLIDLPTKNGVPIPLYENKEIEVTSINKEGIWLGSAEVFKIQKTGLIGAWVQLPSVLEKVQRREYMRWILSFNTQLFVYGVNSNLSSPENIIDVEVKNISGGGIAIISKQKLPQNKFFYIKVDYRDISAMVKIQFIHEQFDAYTKKMTTGFKFLELDFKTIDKIHKIGVFNELQMRRKGFI